MSYSYRWDANGVIELGEPVGQPVGTAAVITTADQEPGIPTNAMGGGSRVVFGIE
jgi:hypothetical protein